jgi:hypothetical protein
MLRPATHQGRNAVLEKGKSYLITMWADIEKPVEWHHCKVVETHDTMAKVSHDGKTVVINLASRAFISAVEEK